MYKAKLKNWITGRRFAKPSELDFGDIKIALPENFQLGFSDNLDTTARQVEVVSAPKNNDYPVKQGDVVLMYEVDQQDIPGETELKYMPLEKAFAVYEDGKVRPLGKNVFVDWDEDETGSTYENIQHLLGSKQISAGGIILPESHTESKLVEATVLAIGEKVDTVKVGERVLFQRFSGMRIKLGQQKGMLANVEVGVYAVL